MVLFSCSPPCSADAPCVTNHLDTASWRDCRSERLGQGWLCTMKQRDFTYSHLLPEKRSILLYDETLTKSCRRCGATYTTKARTRKRCDACREVVAYEKQQRANARLKARRAASRALPRG
jgi:hypothetical protein